MTQTALAPHAVFSTAAVVTLLRQRKRAGFTRASVYCFIAAGEPVVRRAVRGGVVKLTGRAGDRRFEGAKYIAMAAAAVVGLQTVSAAPGDRRVIVVRASKGENEIAAQGAAGAD